MMSKPLAVPGVGLAAAADDELVLAPDHHVLRLAVAPPPGLGWVVRGGGGVLTLDVDQNRRPRALGLKSDAACMAGESYIAGEHIPEHVVSWPNPADWRQSRIAPIITQ